VSPGRCGKPTRAATHARARITAGTQQDTQQHDVARLHASLVACCLRGTSEWERGDFRLTASDNRSYVNSDCGGDALFQAFHNLGRRKYHMLW